MLLAAIGLYTAGAILAPQEPQNSTVQFMSLDALLRAPERPNFPPLGTFLVAYRNNESTNLLTPGDPISIEPDTIVDLLSNSHRDALESDDGLSLDIYRTSLLVSGDRVQVQSIERHLAYIEGSVARPIELTLSVIDWNSAEPPPAALNANDLAQLLANNQPQWQGTVRTRSGRAQTVGHERWTRYVVDCDVEVAQDSFISDPKVSRFFEGCQFVVEPHGLAGSEDVVLMGQFAYSARAGSIATRSTNVKKQPSLDAPDLRMASGSFSGRIQSGGAVVIGMAGDDSAGPNIALVLTARWAAPRPQASTRLTMFPISALTSSALQSDVNSQDDDLGDGEPEVTLATSGDLSIENDNAGPGVLDPDVLIELLRSALPEFDENENNSMQVSGGYLCLLANQQETSTTRDLIRSLEDRTLINTTFELHGDTEAGRIVHRVRVPALRDHNHVLIKGREQPVIVDYEVEIAQEAAVANPVVRNSFSGVSLRFRPGGGSSGTSIDLLGHWIHTDPVQRRPSESSDIGDLYLPSEARRRLSLNGNVPRNQVIDLGSGPRIRLDQELESTNVKVILR